MPSASDDDQDQAIERMLAGRRIAVVGLSDNPSRTSHHIASYLRGAGYEVIPVNPNYATVLGVPCYASLAAVPGTIDVVNVFRRSEFCAEVAKEAVAIGVQGIWLQSGLSSAEAERVARQAGVDYVENRCIMVEHMSRG